MHRKITKKQILIVLVITTLIMQLAIPASAFAASKKRVKSVYYTNVGSYLTLKKGQKKTLKVKVKPGNAKNKKVRYKSSRPSVVSVSKKGVIKAKRKGSAYITATAKDGSGKRDRVKVTVGTRVSSVKYTNITSTYVMSKGSKKTLKVTVKPSNASNKRISWSSSKSSVVSVSSKGVAKAKKKGTAYITAKARDGSGKYTRYKIIVGTRVSKVSILGQNYIGKGGAKIKLSAKVSPSSASYKSVTWKSSNTSIAKVTSSGTITGVKEGTATITASAKDGTGKKGSLKIKVVMPSKNSASFIGHRGYSSIAPENTMAAYNEAVKYGFGGIECDVWQTKGDEQGEKPEVIEQKAKAIAKAAEVQNGSVPYSEDKTEKNPQAARILEENEDTGDGEDTPDTPKEIPGLMIMHDQSLLKMCGVDKLITDLSPSELKQYPIKKGTNIAKYGAQEIPTFASYLKVFQGNSLTPVVEIKSKTPRTKTNAIDPEAADELVKEIKEAGLGKDRNIVIQSFNMQTLLRVMESAKDAAYSDLDLTFLYLTSAESEVTDAAFAEYRAAGLSGVCMKYGIAAPSVIDEAKEYGLKVGVWTVDDTTLAYRLAEIDHVDYVISNKKVFK